MEHRWGHRYKINRIVRLEMRNALAGFGRIRDISISGAWVATELPAKLLCYVQVGFAVRERGRNTVTRVEGQIVRIDHPGFGVEWCEFPPAAVLSILMLRRHRSRIGSPKQGARLQPLRSTHHADRD
jgi:hypothetical protein